MRKGILFVCLLTLFQFSAVAAGYAQASDTASIGKLIRHAFQQLSNNPEAAKAEARKALRLSRSSHYLRGEFYASRILGSYYQNRQHHDSALVYLRESAHAALLTGDTVAQVKASVLQSISLQKTGYSRQAMAVLLKNMAKSEAKKDPLSLALLYRGIGNLYNEQHDYRKAASWQYKALQLLKRVSAHKVEYATTLFALSMPLTQLELYDSAQACLEAVLPVYQKTMSVTDQARVFNSMGSLMLHKHDFDKSKEYLKTALTLYKQTNNIELQVALLNNQGSNYFQIGQLSTALGYYKQALETALKAKNISLQQDVHGNLYWTYKGLGKPAQALYHYEKYTEIQDSLFSLSRSKELAELEKKYETEKRDRKIELLQKTRQLSEAKISQRTTERNAIIAVLSVTLLGGGLTLRSYRQRHRATALLNVKQEELNRQRLRDLEWEHKLATVRASLEGQERERVRIGQELHDRLGSMLSALKLYFYLPAELREMLPAKQLERLETANKLLDDSCQEVRRIAHDMVSNLLIKFGLVEALKELAQTINESNQVRMLVTWHNMNERLDPTTEVTLFRIVQELVTNALKHAQATEINVSILNQEQQSIHLLVEDNGIGFNPEATTNGIGKQILKARVLQLNGHLQIDTGHGIGTTITIDIPLSPLSVNREPDASKREVSLS